MAVHVCTVPFSQPELHESIDSRQPLDCEENLLLLDATLYVSWGTCSCKRPPFTTFRSFARRRRESGTKRGHRDSASPECQSLLTRRARGIWTTLERRNRCRVLRHDGRHRSTHSANFYNEMRPQSITVSSLSSWSFFISLNLSRADFLFPQNDAREQFAMRCKQCVREMCCRVAPIRPAVHLRQNPDLPLTDTMVHQSSNVLHAPFVGN